MKILKYLAAVLLLLFVAIYVVCFTGFGNDLVAKYAQNFIKNKSGIDVKIEKFRLDMSELTLIATANDEINLNANGKISLFSQNFDLDYKITASDLKTANIKLEKPIFINGKAKGKFKNFDINGVGDMLGSNLTFLVNIKNYEPFTAQINAKKLEISQILAILKQPNYANGLIDLTADIKDENGKRDGKASLEIYDGLVNNGTIFRDFNITLPKNFSFKGAFNATINDNTINLKSIFITPIITANAKNTNFLIDKNAINSDFNVQIDDLSKFEPIIKQRLNGTLNLSGNADILENKLKNLDAKISGFGGEINANLKDQNLNAKITNIKLEELLKMAAKPAFATALINGEVVAKNIKADGFLRLNTQNGALNSAELKKLSDINMPNGVKFELKADAKIANSLADFNLDFLTSLFDLKGVNGTFNTDKNDLNAKFALIVSDLARLEKIVGAKLSGAVDIKGDVALKNMALSQLNIAGKALGGNILAQTNGTNLDASLTNLWLKDLFVLVGQQPLANANINLDAKLSTIDIKNLNGNLNLKVNGGEFYAENMSKVLDKKFPNGVKFSANSDIKIAKSVANFNADILSDLVSLKEISGKFYLDDLSFESVAKADIPSLSRLKFITEKELEGAILANINATKKGENLNANLNSKIFNGELVANYKNGNLTANLKSFTFKGLTDMLKMQNFYNGKGSAELKYDTKAQNGVFDVDIIESRLAQNGFTNTIKTFSGRDITTEIYKNGYLKGTIKKGVVNFDMAMTAQRSDINASLATFNTITDAINIPLNFRYEKTDAKIDITGTSKEPKYSVKSDYLEKKIIKGLDKIIDKKLGDSENKDAVKNLIKGLF